MSVARSSFYAILSGLSASASSLFGKLAGVYYSDGASVSTIIAVGFVVMMIVSNGAVWTLYVKALQSSKSSLPVTVTSTAINYFCSAIMGLLLFNEFTSLLWWCGTMLVLLGLILICQTDRTKKHE